MYEEGTGVDIAFKAHEPIDFKLVIWSLRQDVDRLALWGAHDNKATIRRALDLADVHSLTFEESVDLEKSWESSLRDIKDSQDSLLGTNEGNLTISTHI